MGGTTMPSTTSPQPQRNALWVKPREAALLLGLSYETVLRLAKKKKIPTLTYTVRGRDRFLISIAWILSNSKGGKVA